MHSTRARDNAIPTVFTLVGEWEVLARCYVQSPPLRANTTPAASSSAFCVLMMDRNPPPLRPLTTEERTNEKVSVASVFAVQPRVCAGKGRRGEHSAGLNHLQPEFLRRPRAFLARLEARNQPGGVRRHRRTSRTRFGHPPRSRRTGAANS